MWVRLWRVCTRIVGLPDSHRCVESSRVDNGWYMHRRPLICTDNCWYAPLHVGFGCKCCGRRVSRTLRSIIDTASVICFKSCFKSWFPTKSFLPFYVLRRNEMRFHENMLWSVKQCVNCNQIDNIFLWLARSCILYRPLSIIKRCLSFTLILPDVYYSLTV